MLEAAVTTSLVEDAAVPDIRISIRFSPFSQYWKRRMRPLIVLAFLVMLEGSAYAGWEVVAASETGMTVYIDRTTIHRHMYVVTMSVLHDYQVPERLSSGSPSRHNSNMIAEKRAHGLLALLYSQSTWATEQCCTAERVTIRGNQLHR
jgi:hypothetical protein